jgi:outer membrane lipoprotein SlyB
MRGFGWSAIAVLGAALCLAGCSKESGQESVSEAPDTSAVTYGTLIDERDGKKYKVEKPPALQIK